VRWHNLEIHRGVSGFYGPAIRLLSFLRRDDVEVSRRRKKKERSRRDARVGLSRGKWFLRPRDPLYVFFYTAMMLGYRVIARRRSAYAAMPV